MYKGTFKILTKEYIFSHSTTKAGGFTRAQTDALGLSYPPSKGWINRLVGQRFDKEALKLFEEGKFLPAKRARVKSERPLSEVEEYIGIIEALKAELDILKTEQEISNEGYLEMIDKNKDLRRKNSVLSNELFRTKEHLKSKTKYFNSVILKQKDDS